MELATINVESTHALLMSNPAGMRNVKQKLGRKEIPEVEVEAAQRVYRLDDGQLYLPTSAFRGAVVSAAKGRRIGKTAATTMVKGACFPATENTMLFDPGSGEALREWEIDSRRVVQQGQGIVRSRPRIPKWAATVEFEYDEEFIPETMLRELLTIAGRTVGVGDFRPEKSGPFGRFRVIE